MRRLLFIFTCLLTAQSYAQSKLSVSTYSYIRSGEPAYLSPGIQYQARNNWYAEARYNYEDIHTGSVYSGRTFTGGKGITYSLTPMAGILFGKLRGGSAAINAQLESGRFYMSSQTQYCVSAGDCMNSFFFSWSETGYRVLDNVYTGLSAQYTRTYQSTATIEPGFFTSLTYRQYSFQVYCFTPLHEHGFFVLGITREWKYPSGGHSKSSKPLSPKKNKGVLY